MKKKLTGYYALTQFFYWVSFASLISYSSYYLLGRGLTNTHIGIITATAGLVSVVLQPLTGALMDRYPRMNSRRMMGLLCILITAGGAVLMLLPDDARLLTGIVYGLLIMLMQQGMPMMNILGVESLSADASMKFSTGRAIGSLGYAASAWAMGMLVTKFPPVTIPVVMVAFILLMGAVILVYPLESKGVRKRENSSLSLVVFLRKYPSFPLLLASLVMIYFGHMVTNTYAFQIVTSRGGGSAEMGTATAIAAVCELIMVFLFPKYSRILSLETILRISGVFFTLKVVCTLLARTVPAFFGAQALQMYAWGLLVVGLVYYVDRMMQPEDRSKGQSYTSLTQTIATVVGGLLGGWMIDRWGIDRLLLTAAVVSGAGCVLMWAATSKSPEASSKN